MADADPRNRINHYGSQPVDSVRGLRKELDDKQDGNPKLNAISEAELRTDAHKGQVAVFHGDDSVTFRKIGLGPSDLVTRELAEKLFSDHGGGGAGSPFQPTTFFAGGVGAAQIEAMRDAAQDSAIIAVDAAEDAVNTALGINALIVTPQQYGAVADGVADDSAAILTAIAVLRTNRIIGYGYGAGGGKLTFPKGVYNCGSTTIAVDFPLIIEGEFGSGPSGGGSVLKWTSNVTGLWIKGDDSTGGAVGSIIRNLFLKGAYTSTESEAHGIDVDAKCSIRDVYIEYFAGDGINLDSSGPNTNQNDTEIFHPFIRYCRNGIYGFGNDVNAVTIFHPEMMLNRRYGVWIKDTIGSTLIGGDYSTNARNADATSSAMCTSSSKWYYVLPGQEAGASTNAPSGTTANNTWWGYISAGSADGQHPAWTSGLTWISGGVLRIEGGSSYFAILGGYAEGDQPPVQLDGHVMMMAPLLGTAVQFDGSPYGGQITGVAAQVQVHGALKVGNDDLAPANKQLTVGGDITLSPAAGQVYDPTFRINSTNAYGTIIWQVNGVDRAGIQWAGASNNLILSNTVLGGGHELSNSNGSAALTRLIFSNISGSHEIRYERRGGADFFGGNATYEFQCGASGNPDVILGDTGVNLKTGKVLKVNSQQVVGARGAALPADATDLASALTLINAIKARLKTTGGHGLVAD